jgi:hypothetical protein
VSPRGAERFVVLNMRVLAISFAIVGILFISTPDGVVQVMDDVGDAIGSFDHGPDTEMKLWLALGFAYMTVITGIALLVSTDVVRYRPLLLVLAAGKAASSLAAGAFYLDEQVFIYLANFLVDGYLAGLSLACWSLAGRVADPVAAPG